MAQQINFGWGWLFDFGQLRSVAEVAGKRTTSESIPSSGFPRNLLFFLLRPQSPNIKGNLLIGRVELSKVDLDIFDLLLILPKLSVGFLLRIEMREHLVIDPELKTLALLDDVQREAVEGEGILEGDVGWKLVLEEDLAVYGDLDFAGNEGEVKYDGMRLIFEGDIPSEPLFATLHVFANLLHVEL